MLFRFWLVLVSLIGMCRVAFAQAQPAADAAMFVPTNTSYALTALKRFVGCSLDTFWVRGGGEAAGSCSSSDTMFVSIVGYFNIGVLVLAVAVGTYTIYALTADSASDGEVLGRSTETKYTFFKIGLGIFGFLPVAAGFSIIQILALQLIVWSNGFADTAWSRMGVQLVQQSAKSVITEKFMPNPQVSASIADALYTRTLGYVCMRRLNDVSVALGRNGRVSARTARAEAYTNVHGETVNMTVFDFYIPQEYYYNRSGCGRFQLARPVSAPRTSESQSVGASVETKLAEMAETVMPEIFVRVGTRIDGKAQVLAAMVTDGQRNGAKFSEQVAKDFNEIMTDLRKEVDTALLSRGEQLRQATQGSIQQASKDGWAVSILYQRILSNAYAGASAIAQGLKFQRSEPDSLEALMGWTDTWRLFGNGSITAPFREKFTSDLQFLDTQKGAFQGVGTSFGPAGGENVRIDTVDADTGWFERMVRRTLETVTPSQSTVNYREWRDPIPEIQAVGNNMAIAAAGAAAITGASWVAGIALPQFASVADGAASIFASLTKFLFYAAFVLAGIVPLIPLIYWSGAVFSWFTAVLSLLVALPLWLLSFMMPSRQASLVGSSLQGMLMILGVILKPIMLIVGLITAMLLMRVGFDFWNFVMMNAYGSTSATAGTLGGIMLLLGVTLIYVIGVILIVVWSCGFISELGDATLRYIDAQAAALFNNRFGETLSGAVNPVGRAAGFGGAAGAAASAPFRTAKDRLSEAGAADRANSRSQRGVPAATAGKRLLGRG